LVDVIAGREERQEPLNQMGSNPALATPERVANDNDDHCDTGGGDKNNGSGGVVI